MEKAYIVYLYWLSHSHWFQETAARTSRVFFSERVHAVSLTKLS